MHSIAIDELHIGFSGTRKGMSKYQKRLVTMGLKKKWKQNPTPTKYFHHGDCVGADAEAHDIAAAIGYVCVIHPPDNPKLRAWKEGIVLPAKPYMARNFDIVDMSHYLLATPKTATVSRSGTWGTINYAKIEDKLWKVIPPYVLV